MGQLLPRQVEGLEAMDVAFGDALKGEFYLPRNKKLPAQASTAEKWPIVIWLHPESYGSGYSRYAFWAPLIRQGFAVFTFDQIGFGSRSGHALNFYRRYPEWSLMGKMVADTRAAISAVSALTVVDRENIYIAGLGMGAQVGLVTAALDDRVKGISTITGLGTLRTMKPDMDTEGIRRYSHLHGLLPKLGFFVGRENRIPIDFDEILAAIAPRPVFAVAPTLDRNYPVDDARRLIETLQPLYRMLGNEGGIEIRTPIDFSRFPNEVQKPAYDWLMMMAKRTQSGLAKDRILHPSK